jgi:16S rRNA (uracil1498-N3)-methyltransferase
MTRRRWIADEFSGDRAALTGTHATHLSRTLRARVGQQFEVACGDQVRQATISSVQDERVEFNLGEEVVASQTVPITLLLAIFKFDRMEWAIEKCTELNVSAIIPVIARRTEKHLAIAAAKRTERWRRIARDAAEQSRRIVPPQIGDPMKLKEALAKLSDPDMPAVIARENSGPSREICGRSGCNFRIVLAETESGVTLSEVLSERANATSLALAVGPEGGWAEDELQSFAASHWVATSLGDTILRAETAAMAAVVIARAEF